MSTYDTTTKERTAVRPTYVLLGTDAEGGTHLYRTSDETIFAFSPDGTRQYRFDVAGIAVDDYVAHVTDARGWAHCNYAPGGIGGMLARALGDT